MEISDFGLTIAQLNDTTAIIPVSIANRLVDEINEDRYRQGRILSLVDMRTMEVRDVVGHFPPSFIEKPTPKFEFFDYDVDYMHGKLYVSFSSDPQIYVYDLSDIGAPLYSFGFDAEGINRDYTVGYGTMENLSEVFGNDIKHVGVNTGLYYDRKDDLLLRTSLCDMNSGIVMLQVYKNDNLIHEQAMPQYFKLLGRYGNHYYGTRFLPNDNGNESNFVLYRFSL